MEIAIADSRGTCRVLSILFRDAIKNFVIIQEAGKKYFARGTVTALLNVQRSLLKNLNAISERRQPTVCEISQ